MWEVGYFCKNCDKEVTYHQTHFAKVCPHCAVPANWLRLDVVLKVRRWVWDEPEVGFWGRLWGKQRKGHWEYKK